ncbi:MAG: transaldolase family protein, partial [Candidatus Methylomirabilales bacterium]
NAKMVYRRFRQIFYGEPFTALRKRGARVQGPLWASTGTKNPAYSDVLYLEELIVPDTVNTLPPVTLDAFRDHGRVRGATGQERLPEAEGALARLAKLGIPLEAISEELQADGVTSFAGSFEQLLAAMQEKRKALLADQAEHQNLTLGGLETARSARLSSR